MKNFLIFLIFNKLLDLLFEAIISFRFNIKKGDML